jgi:hypothetical protein
LKPYRRQKPDLKQPTPRVIPCLGFRVQVLVGLRRVFEVLPTQFVPYLYPVQLTI